MKKIIILFILLTGNIFSQSLSLFDIDTTGYPIIKAKFYAFDKDGKQIINLNTNDFYITENGEIRKVLSVKCPAPNTPQALSSVLVMDVSGSMEGTSIALAQEGARAWIRGLPLGKSECAITSFDTRNYFVQDFTTNRDLLENKILNVYRGGGTDYNAAFTSPMAGGILVAKTGKYKKVIIILSDGQPNFEPNTNEIIKQAEQNGITVYSVTLGYQCPQCLKSITERTGGQWFENVTTEEQAREVYLKILDLAQGGEPCTIEWESRVSCVAGITNVEFQITNLNLTAKASYQSPNTTVAKLEFNPASIKFNSPIVGVKKDTIITVTAHNSDFTVTGITGNNPAFSITPVDFILYAGQSRQITVSYFPADSGYNYCNFDVSCTPCPAKFYTSGGWKGKKPKIRTLKLIHPNGGEVFVAGNDTLITWEGVTPDESVIIEYSTNNGAYWIPIADSAKGLSYYWKVPNTPSNSCLARVTARAGYVRTDYPEVEICNQVWMGVNLDVDYYRNGDPIPEVTDSAQWATLTTGAWCYYNNDPAMGALYGKLYNWYAVNDPRGLAPEGWHVPTDEDWKELEMCLGMNITEVEKSGWRGTVQGSLLAGWSHLWSDGILDKNANFEKSGFLALPSGLLSAVDLSFRGIKEKTYWWTDSESDEKNTWYRSIIFTDSKVLREKLLKTNGFSVRCVRD